MVRFVLVAAAAAFTGHAIAVLAVERYTLLGVAFGGHSVAPALVAASSAVISVRSLSDWETSLQ